MFDWLKKSSPPSTPAQPGSTQPDNSLACKLQGDALLDAGKFVEAAASYRQAIVLNPGYAEAYNNLANALRESGLLEEAESCLKQAISIKPELAFAHYNLGSLLQAQGRLSEAIDHFNMAVQHKPEVEPFYVDLFRARLQAGQIEEAKAAISKGLTFNPAFPDFHFLLAALYEQTGERDKTIECYRKGLALQPGSATGHFKMGSLLQEQGKHEEAVSSYNAALSLKPNAPEIYFNLALISNSSGNSAEAISCYQKAIELRPDFSFALCNLGTVYLGLGNLDAAESCFTRAVEVEPSLVEAWYSLGLALTSKQKNLAAIGSLKRALELEPDNATSRILMLHQLQRICSWNDFDEHVRSIRLAAAEEIDSEKNQLSPLIFLSLPGSTAEEQKQCAQRFTHHEYQGLTASRNKLAFDHSRPRNKKIRIGYLSADFHDHATARLMAEIFELHDRKHFHVTAYSYGPDDGSSMRKRLENAFDAFQDIHDFSLEESAKRIYANQMDILVDLKGYTENTRSGILALRPAPIQVNYLGYPGTMSADFVDYLIADPYIIPAEQLVHYTERVVYMPDCYQPTDRSRPRLPAPARNECGLPDDDFIFCCFNQTYKITPEVFGVWCQLLHAIPTSRLWLWSSTPQAEENLKLEAKNRGVDPNRLIMAPKLEALKHLARLQCADLFLDTSPYNAHTTCSDALWMGLPVVTCTGETFPSRVAGSLLNAIGAPELITYNLDDYYQLALELASNPDKLAAIRSKIIANRDTAPLFDSTRFTRNLEQAFFQMLKDHADSFPVFH